MVVLAFLAIGMVIAHLLFFVLGYHLYVVTLSSTGQEAQLRSNGEMSVFQGHSGRSSLKLDPDEIDTEGDWSEEESEDDTNR